MQPKTVNLEESQTNLKDMLALVRNGTEIVLTDGAAPFARLVPVRRTTTPRVPGLHAGAMRTTDDFDDPLPDLFWTESA